MNAAIQGLIIIIIGIGGCLSYFYLSNQLLDKVLFPPRGETPEITSLAPTWSGRGCSSSRPCS